LVLVLILSVFVIEFGVMALVRAMTLPLPAWGENAIDAAVLSLLLVPLLYVLVFRPLSRQNQELKAGAESLIAMQDDLEVRVEARTRELEQRNREIKLLGDMSEFLQACTTIGEACGVIEKAGKQLFPNASGGLFVYSASRNDLEGLASWGGALLNPDEQVFLPDACWALRLGRVYEDQDPQSCSSCRRADGVVPGQCLCVPMIAQGEVLGVLRLSQGCGGGDPLKGQLAVTLAEHVAIALTNLKLRETLRNQSIRDPLTGLFNRRYMEETLTREIQRAVRTRDPVGVVMLDLDHFKRFNDTHGHDAGDHVLRELGAFLNAQVRGGDIACRFGGEEFMLILPNLGPESLVQRVDTMRLGVKQLAIRHLGQSLGSLTMSAGAAVFPDHGSTGEALLRSADQALYRAKAAGRDRVVLATSEPVLDA
jgi:diguanylate cyclase (GGDEF)-like protein